MAPSLPGYRPYPAPTRPWLQRQVWHDLLFAHWPVPPEMLRPLMPAALALDTYESQAWLGVIPFRISGLRLRGLPAVPGISAFLELNVRTYVTVGGRLGVYFFSLDAGSPLAVGGARFWYRLPYYWAWMRMSRGHGWIEYRSRRLGPGAAPARYAGRYRPVGEASVAEPGSLAYFLTARYCLYTVGGGGRVVRAEIDHPPWRLQPAEAQIVHNTMAAAAGIELPDAAPRLHFARRMDVMVWGPEPAE